MRRMSRAARLLRLMQELRRHRAPVAAHDLAETLGVSVRSLYRDVATLREQGAAIEGEAGMGYVLLPGFVLPPLMFGEDELEAIVLGLRLAEVHGDDVLGDAAIDVLAKLRAVLPRALRDLVDSTALLAAPIVETRDAPTCALDLARVRKTIRAQRKVRIAYADKDDRATERTIWPIALAFFERVRVVVSWCELRDDFRSFRADRIAGWIDTREPIPRPRAALLRAWREREGIAEPLDARRGRGATRGRVAGRSTIKTAADKS
jgi:predicted DNA-binding transcriptional regulator YafY